MYSVQGLGVRGTSEEVDRLTAGDADTLDAMHISTCALMQIKEQKERERGLVTLSLSVPLNQTRTL